MIDLRRGPCLALEAPEGDRIAEERSHHHLGRDAALQPQVGRFEHGAEAAAPQCALEPVLAVERPLDRQRQREFARRRRRSAPSRRRSSGRTPDIP